MQAARFFGPGCEWENPWTLPSNPVKLPKDNRTLWKIRTAIGLPFEYDDLSQCHDEIKRELRKHPEKRSALEGMV